MPYVLEAITAADQEKIIQDTASDVEKRTKLSAAKKANCFTDTWAIDKEKNCYLLLMPFAMREETTDKPYYAFVNGCMYRINRVGQEGDEVYFDEPSLPAQDVLAVVETEVAAAFSVYGSMGVGPLTKAGYPHFALVPVFTKKGA